MKWHTHTAHVNTGTLHMAFAHTAHNFVPLHTRNMCTWHTYRREHKEVQTSNADTKCPKNKKQDKKKRERERDRKGQPK